MERNRAVPIRFVTEAVMLAVYGNLLMPEKPVEYLVPASTVDELYEMLNSPEPIVGDRNEREVRETIRELIAFLEMPFFRKMVNNALVAPWRKSPSFPVNEKVSLSVMYAVEAEEFGETFDVVETELLLTALHEKLPLLTDQVDLIDRMVEAEVPVVVVDIDDFEYAVETGLAHHFGEE